MSMNSSRFTVGSNDANASLASLMTMDSPALRGSVSRYASRFLDTSVNTTQLSNATLTNWSRTATELPSTLQFDSTLTSVAGNITATTGIGERTMLLEEDHRNMSESCAALIELFCNTFKDFGNTENAFQLLNELQGICCDYIQAAQEQRTKRPTFTGINKDELFSTSVEKMLRIERNTWRLAYVLYQNRLKEVSPDERMAVDEGVQSDFEVIDGLVDRNKEVSQMQLIIDWLEMNERDDLIDEDKLNFYSDGRHYWENTLHAAKTRRKTRIGQPQEREISLQMDPDAPFRSRKPLHELDKEDESRVMRSIFKFMRAGKIDEGQKLAQTLGFHWLAAALEGWRLYHDPKYPDENLKEGEEGLIDGNSCRDLWKYVCWENSKLTDLSQYEKAIFAALSGNVAAILPVCNRWADKLWAYYRASIDVHVEKELLNTTIPKPVTAKCSGVISESRRFSVQLPPEYWANGRQDEEIFKEVDALMKEQFSPEEQCHSYIQRNLATNNIDELLNVIISWTRTHENDELRPQMLRFFAHLVLFLQNIGVLRTDEQQTLFNTILESYIAYLIENKSLPFIAPYVARLPHDRQIFNYAKLLKKVTDPNERRFCHKSARDAGLDIDEITKTVVEETVPIQVPPEAMEQIGDITKLSIQDRIESEDLAKIDALEWLLISNIQHIELLKQGNSLMRSFLLTGKLESAKTVLYKIPLDIADEVVKAWCRKSGTTELSSELHNLLREYLSYKSFFECQGSFDVWLKFYHNSKPKEPIRPTSKKFTDMVAYEQHLKSYEHDLMHWHKVLASHGEKVSIKIISILQNNDGGWMRDVGDSEASPAAESRRQQLDAMRKMYIPQLTFMAQTVLLTSNLIKSSIEFANIIASEEHQLYKEFTPELLKDFLRKIRESSITGLNQGLDALGHPANQ